MNKRNNIVAGGGSRDLFYHITNISNLLAAWKEFKKGKIKKEDVTRFEFHVEENIFALHDELVSKKYVHGPYLDFYICDPKRRHIHKSVVRDRVVHQAVFRKLYPVFEKNFIYDSYSSRLKKGTHLGIVRLEQACRRISKNWRIFAYALKCDIRKFFDSIDHNILKKIILRNIKDGDALWLLDVILGSFEKIKGRGLPLGNVTSQLFGNIYLNELDQYVKHVLKAKHYFRYCDDFLIVCTDRQFLEDYKEKIGIFLKEKLSLDLHPNKIQIRKLRQGIDFVGYITLPHARVLRTATKKRIIRKIAEAKEKFTDRKITGGTYRSITASYEGVISHCRSRKITAYIKKFKF